MFVISFQNAQSKRPIEEETDVILAYTEGEEKFGVVFR